MSLKRGRPDARTPPGLGAALRSISDQADEPRQHTASGLRAQQVPPILRRHWFRPDEWELVA